MTPSSRRATTVFYTEVSFISNVSFFIGRPALREKKLNKVFNQSRLGLKTTRLKVK